MVGNLDAAGPRQPQTDAFHPGIVEGVAPGAELGDPRTAVRTAEMGLGPRAPDVGAGAEQQAEMRCGGLARNGRPTGAGA